jgi:hypothetical protein
MSVFPKTDVVKTIPGLVLYLDASDATTIDASSVSEWKDKSGNNNHATQGTGGSQPSSGVSTLNNMNVIDFDGTADYLNANGVSAYITGNDTPFTIFTVFRPTDDTPVAPEVFTAAGSSSSATPFYETFVQSDSSMRITKRDDASAVVNITQSATTGARIHTQAFSGTTISTWINGTLDNDEEALNLGAMTVDRFSIGALVRTSVSLHFEGSIAEVAVYKTRLSDDDVNLLNMHYSNKWGTES